jgi:hypothetical protein
LLVFAIFTRVTMTRLEAISFAHVIPMSKASAARYALAGLGRRAPIIQIGERRWQIFLPAANSAARIRRKTASQINLEVR